MKHLIRLMIGFLNRDLTSQTWLQKSDHPFFGDILLFAFKDSEKSYWEAETNVENCLISICIDAPKLEEPSPQQTDFARQIITKPDIAFARTLPLLAQEFERWHKKALPTEWRTALKFVGFTVPVDGDDNNEWELSYESLWDRNEHVLTCCFKDGSPHYVSVDG